ncbi:type II secretion system F family protein [Afifella sp. IM 167]|uniref:type II secretion system F family protein n=1 Tax=Afifella sp. IM 167 TaxID=2033586 RepID=UPI001CCFEE48|nr:type II secretion system F family protein [Afifella sp. IM 167]MBZ8133781.1 pilus assembly protein [Afifella sp. IM 167]
MIQFALFGLVAFSIGGILYALFYARLSGGSRSQKRVDVVAAGAASPAHDRRPGEDGRRRRSVEDTLREIEEQQKAKGKRGSKPTLIMRMRQAGLKWSVRTFAIVCVLSVLVMIPAIAFLTGLPLLPSIGFGLGLGIFLPYGYVGFLRKRRFKQFTNEFPNALDVITRGVKAGLPLVDCLKIIASEASPPVSTEFREVVEDQTLGLPLDEAISKLPERIPLPEANFFAIVITIQSRSGGSLSEALSNLSKVLRDRKKMDAKIRAMSQEAKSSAAIIGSLPIIVALLVYFTSPDYILLLFNTTIGQIVLCISAMWMGMGILVMRKMINFDF